MCYRQYEDLYQIVSNDLRAKYSYPDSCQFTDRKDMQQSLPLFNIEKDHFSVKEFVTEDMLKYSNSIAIQMIEEKLLDAEDLLVIRDDMIGNADLEIIYIYLCICRSKRLPSVTLDNESKTIICQLP